MTEAEKDSGDIIFAIRTSSRNTRECKWIWDIIALVCRLQEENSLLKQHRAINHIISWRTLTFLLFSPFLHALLPLRLPGTSGVEGHAIGEATEIEPLPNYFRVGITLLRIMCLPIFPRIMSASVVNSRVWPYLYALIAYAGARDAVAIWIAYYIYSFNRVLPPNGSN